MPLQYYDSSGVLILKEDKDKMSPLNIANKKSDAEHHYNNQLAGVTGIEPVNGEFRVHCLTAWRHPKFKYINTGLAGISVLQSRLVLLLVK